MPAVLDPIQCIVASCAVTDVATSSIQLVTIIVTHFFPQRARANESECEEAMNWNAGMSTTKFHSQVSTVEDGG